MFLRTNWKRSWCQRVVTSFVFHRDNHEGCARAHWVTGCVLFLLFDSNALNNGSAAMNNFAVCRVRCSHEPNLGRSALSLTGLLGDDLRNNSAGQQLISFFPTTHGSSAARIAEATYAFRA